MSRIADNQPETLRGDSASLNYCCGSVACDIRFCALLRTCSSIEMLGAARLVEGVASLRDGVVLTPHLSASSWARMSFFSAGTSELLFGLATTLVLESSRVWQNRVHDAAQLCLVLWHLLDERAAPRRLSRLTVPWGVYLKRRTVAAARRFLPCLLCVLRLRGALGTTSSALCGLLQ